MLTPIRHGRFIKVALLFFVLGLSLFISNPEANSTQETQYWLKLKAKDKFQRSLIANTGASIEQIEGDFVMALASTASKRELEQLGLVVEVKPSLWALDFPEADKDFHNYFELEDELFTLQTDYPDLVKLNSLGSTYEGRSIWNLEISGNLSAAKTLPGIFFVGGHHAREHLSVEVPLLLAKHLLQAYRAGDARIVKLLDSRIVHITPAMNPDGLEFDVSTGKYQYWRKNRRANSDRTYGVDLNRNYGYKWGTGGSSKRGDDETYMGAAPFSEPETIAIRDFLNNNTNIKVVLSFHTFSELILYPWGWSNSKVAEQTPRRVFETMAKRMSQWNGYTPQQSSDLYIASGDMTDWAYATHGMIAFTFELDPKGGFNRDGFYPGAKVIPTVFQKNLEPALYLMEYADDPTRVLAN